MPEPLVVIVGPTASGKTALALHIAQKYNGEIICVDSRTIYKGMDIGTAKPNNKDKTVVPHHLLDIADPTEQINVASFTTLAKDKINDIAKQGKLPIVVGGSGLYIDALIYNFDFAVKANEDQRQLLQKLTVPQMQNILKQKGIDLPFNKNNPRHLIRYIETCGHMGTRREFRPNTIVIGLNINNSDLKHSISKRTEQMFKEGLEAEVSGLAKRYGWDSILSSTIGYQEFILYFKGECSLEDVKQAIISATNRLVKRQNTWFKRSKEIHWVNKVAEVDALLTTFLNK